MKKSSLLAVLAAIFILSDVTLRFVWFSDPVVLQSPVWDETADLMAPRQYARLKANAEYDPPAGTGVFTFHVKTNGFGMRNGPVSLNKAEGVTRIAVMGGSAAFGWGVPAEQAFPSQLQTLLGVLSEKYEVLNFGAPMFSSHQGLTQYSQLVHNFNPDILILTYGLYDSFDARLSDAEWHDLNQRTGAYDDLGGVWGVLDRYSAAGRFWLERSRVKARDVLLNELKHRAEANEWKPRVSPAELKENLKLIIDHQTGRGGKTILAHLNLLNRRSLAPLKELAAAEKVPLVDLRDLFDNLGGRDEREKAIRMGLKPALVERIVNGTRSKLTFRLYANEHDAAGGFSIVGDAPELGDGVPNKVRMYDDGSHGDERSRDQVWTYTIESRFDRPLDYAFTPNAAEGQWAADESGFLNTARNQAFFYRAEPAAWAPAVEWRSLLHIYGERPFEELLIPGPDALPNAKGHAAIAQRLADVILHPNAARIAMPHAAEAEHG
ncbi:MAG: hypothetical protein GC154_14680 [bacterium]|nr:hypothetical protein [bacterium]